MAKKFVNVDSINEEHGKWEAKAGNNLFSIVDGEGWMLFTVPLKPREG
ncbi:MAG: hypothetical protein RDV48_05610 [Candidatus Eremiobacteraeota bacterium]|nr:hypothetical protein [Candidatus Eremiobacteraeota bacterium]